MKKTFNLQTMFTLFLAAPFIVLIVMIFIFMGMYEGRHASEYSLEAPKYLINPLREIIESDYDPRISSPDGILLLLDNNGSVVYSAASPFSEIELENSSDIFGLMLSEGLGNISMAHYNYKGQSFFCFYENSIVPAVYQKQMRIGISIFIVIISCLGLFFGQISNVIINSSIKKLIEASERIAEGNLEDGVTLKYHNELIHVANAIDKMRLELKEKRNVEQRFVMSVTHDLKTPLTSINGYLEAISDGIISDPEEILQTIQLMQTKSELLDNRINELLDYSRSRTAGWREDWREIPINQWLGNMSSMFKSDAELYGRKYMDHINVEENSTIKGDEKLLTRALENLFDNACRYTENGDYIIFSSSVLQGEEGQRIEIIMEDSGAGISREDMDKIFQLFYRNDRGRNSRGMGIGLASVQTIVEDHGGKISCSDSESGGAKFRIELPI